MATDELSAGCGGGYRAKGAAGRRRDPGACVVAFLDFAGRAPKAEGVFRLSPRPDHVNNHLMRTFVLAVSAGLLSSCAVTTSGVQPPRSMPAARAALRPEFRIFYDTLQDYGDWVLIEPYGYVFRPRVDFHTWRPYESGFWAPSDSYGWVWISSEPYGWATYHYGRWFYDDFQSWVWQPGLEWGPAWVSWQGSDQYVGWTPLAPGSGWRPLDAQVPGGRYLYTTVDQLGTTDLQVRRESQLGEEVAKAQPIENDAVVDGVRVPTGPSIERIERATGRMLTRVRIADLVPQAGRGPEPGVPAGAPAQAGPGPSQGVTGSGAPGSASALRLDETRRAGEQAAREARALKARGGVVPARVPVVRLLGLPIELRGRPAGRDSTRAKPGG